MTAARKAVSGGQAEEVTTPRHQTPVGSAAPDLREGLEAYYVQNRSRLVAFIERKVGGDRGLAEDILHDGFVRALRSAPELEDAERLVSWLYRILRNAISDSYRREGATKRKLDRLALTAPGAEMPLEDDAVLCACLEDLLPTLKPEYADILRAMELGEAGTDEMASRLGITVNNLKVRRHRARRQLRERLIRTCRTCAKHGCLDCTCSRPVS